MTVEDIIQGESKNIEFKVQLPKDSSKYVKTVIAFSNTSGGEIIIGVDDETREIIGVNEKEVFQIIDKIANAVSDHCEPQIIPDISFQSIDHKCIIIIKIYPGSSRPYYFKNVGKEKGTYVRIAGTSRPADEVKIKELELEGSNLSWDELACIDYSVTETAVDKLCDDIKRYMIRSATTAEDKKNVPDILVEHLLNWRILRPRENKIIATNAFVALTSNYFRFSRIQCALFKGIDRDVFIDKKDCTGPLYEQIEEAYHFVLRNIRLSSEIEELVREDKYELPTAAIREMIINAVIHRNFMDSSCVQVAIYDDRVEVTSPGMLYGGLSIEEAKSGRSKIRNKAIAEIFRRMEIVESWGTGIRRIIARAKEYGLPDPEFIEIGDTFRVNLFKATPKMSPKMSPKNRAKLTEISEKFNLSKPQIEVLELVCANPQITRQEIAQTTGKSIVTVKRHIATLNAVGILEYVGSSKKGQWVVELDVDIK